MGVNVVVEEPIGRPREEVAAFAMDPANDREWIGALTSVRVVDGDRRADREGAPPVGVGTRVERVAAFLGRRIVYVNEITELVPGARLAMRSVQAPFPMRVTYEFEDAPGGGTLARIRAGGETGRYYLLAGPLLSAMVRRGIRRDLRALRRRLEG